MENKAHGVVNAIGIEKGIKKYDESNGDGAVLGLFIDIINTLKGDEKLKVGLVANIGKEDTSLNTKEDVVQQVIINKVLLSTLLTLSDSNSKEVSNLIPLCNCLMKTDEWLYLVEHNVLPFIFK